MNVNLLEEMRKQLLGIIQKNAGWLSEEQFIELSHSIGKLVDRVKEEQLQQKYD